MVKHKIYSRGKKCSCCGQDRWVRTKMSMRYMVINNHRDSAFFGEHSRGIDYIFGVKVYNEEICLFCFDLLIGMEDYFDEFFYGIVSKHKEEATKIIKKIFSDKEIIKKVSKFVNKGKYIPNTLIQEIQGGGGNSSQP